jgi:hypothetical protein
MNQAEMTELLREIDECASRASWKDMGPGLEEPTAKSFIAEIDGWTLMVVSVEIGGARGYDGTAVRTGAGLVMRLTRELAEKFYKAASKHKHVPDWSTLQHADGPGDGTIDVWCACGRSGSAKIAPENILWGEEEGDL